MKHLSDFILAYRWTDENYDLLSDAHLELIEPLEKAEARSEDARLSELILDTPGLNPEKFTSIQTQDASDYCPKFIANLAMSPETPIVLSWEPDVAIRTRWSVFSAQPEAFCYPASDDLYIAPVSDEWLLFYYHEEVFWFGKRQ